MLFASSDRTRVEEAALERLEELFQLAQQGQIRIHDMARTKENALWRLTYTDNRV